MSDSHSGHHLCCGRRELLKAAGLVTGAAILGSGRSSSAAEAAATRPSGKRMATIRGAFLYPPSKSLDEAGYWSWPGSTFDAEGRQREYMRQIRQMEKDLGLQIVIDDKPLDTADDVTAFINEVRQSGPDGLLLIPFKKGHWAHVVRIVDETHVPSVILATLGVLLVNHINQLRTRSGVYLISALDDLQAVRSGLKMIHTARSMKDARLINIYGSETKEAQEPQLGTLVRTIPHARFVDAFQQQESTDAVRELAAAYRKGAREIVEPSGEDILEAARACLALKRIVREEQADAIMMDCLPGLQKPRKHPPPCMGFMTLRDEGIPIGCQSDLNATLTLMLVQRLFDRPGFQQNAAVNTEQNLYFGAHCTSPSRMNGPDAPAEPYCLRSHAEAGWGCVPRVLFPPDQEVTMALYLAGDKPQMLVYSGRIVRCPDIPPAGGCRTNLEMTINELDDVCQVKGMHQVIFYGHRVSELRRFCQLYNIDVVT